MTTYRNNFGMSSLTLPRRKTMTMICWAMLHLRVDFFSYISLLRVNKDLRPQEAVITACSKLQWRQKKSRICCDYLLYAAIKRGSKGTWRCHPPQTSSTSMKCNIKPLWDIRVGRWSFCPEKTAWGPDSLPYRESCNDWWVLLLWDLLAFGIFFLCSS